MTILEITLYGDPIPKGRPRMSANGHIHTPERTLSAERAAASAIQEAMVGIDPVSTPVGIHVEFFCATKRKTDHDNLLKLVTDAMNQLVYLDDSQIEVWSGRLVRGVGKKEALTRIRVWELVLPQATQVDALPAADGLRRFVLGEVGTVRDHQRAGAVVGDRDDAPDPPDVEVTFESDP